MAEKNKVIRSFDSRECLLRALEDGKTIEGYAIVFNQRSLLLIDWNIYKNVMEVISPDAISDSLLRSADVICNINHNGDRMLARCTNGSGSLTLTRDDTGLKFSFQVPDTPDGKTAYEGVKRGDFSGCSFAYYNDDDEVNVSYTKETDANGEPVIIRTVNKIDHLLDVSIVVHPAYPQTSVDTRGAEMAKEIMRSFPSELLPEKEEDHTAEMESDVDKLNKIFNL